MKCANFAVILALATCLAIPGVTPSAYAAADLSDAVVVSPSNGDPISEKTVRFLREELARRTGITLPVQHAVPADLPAIVLLKPGKGEALPEAPEGLVVPEAQEAYALWTASARIYAAAHDNRGLLFAAAHLIRLFDLAPGTIGAPDQIALSSAPAYPIRGHQLGYRNTANTYDAWDLATFDQYIRDLILFGTNTIELIPPFHPSDSDSPLMKMQAWDMNIALTDLIASYGLDVGLWIPVTDDVTTPEGAAEALKTRRRMLESMKRVDAVLVPGGDDGDTPAEFLMPWLKDFAKILDELHPDAKLWVSNQTFTKEENDYFFDFLEAEKEGGWLDGVAYGPWTSVTMAETRERTPDEYRLRRYPDINHMVRCQYPQRDWDWPLAHTLGREAVSPRPRDMAHIHNLFMDLADGFVAYSDGVHDDLNKCVWSALGWNPTTKVEAIARDYANLFLGNTHADLGVKALLGLEDNWRGPVVENASIPATLDEWKEIAKDESLAKNWRLQMYLLRAYYDAYVQAKALREAAYESEALAALDTADNAGAAMAKAREILSKADADIAVDPFRREIEALAPQLWESIGYQLSIKPPYLARNAERGALLDTLDQPLNNRVWMEHEFQRIGKLANEAEKLARLARIVHWEDPGAGGFYDDLGNLSKQPHLVRQVSWEDDPGYLKSSQLEFSSFMNNRTLEQQPVRLSWKDCAQTLYGTPLRMHYEDLDPAAEYALRVNYAGRFGATMRLVADESIEIHPALARPEEGTILEFEIPKEATSDGVLDLEWQWIASRGCQVAEVWLVKSGKG